MSNLDDPAILSAYNAVRSDTDATTWLILSYSGSGDKLSLSASGTGDISTLAAAFDAAQAQYGYARVEYANDAESRRVKFVFVVWIGPQTPVMRKGRVSVQAAEVRRVLSHHSITVDARDVDDLEQEEIVKRLRKAGGADYNGGRG